MKPVLILVDLQADFLAAPELQPPAEVLVARAAGLLQRFRQQHLPVLHVWTTVHRETDDRLPHWRRENRWMCVADTEGHQPPEALRPREGEPVLHKRGFDAFIGDGLERMLQGIPLDTVIVAGLHLHACVRAVAVGCLERGWAVRIADDAVASHDPIFAAATRRWLADRCVVFEPATSILRDLNPSSPASWTHHSPRSTEETLFEIAVADAAAVNAVILKVRAAWEGWRQMAPADRLQILDRFATRLDGAAQELSRQMALEIGKPVSHGLEEVRRAAASVRDVIRRAAAHPVLVREPAGQVRYRPLGIVGLITAWNNPVAIPAGKIAPALAYGNAVVWKPAPAGTPLARALLALLHHCGVPEAVVGLVTGDPSTSRCLAAHPLMDAVTLTGSLQAGQTIQEICARRMTPLQAELSGNNAAIVWEDADLDEAAAQVAWGAFAFAGQRCTANRRMIVPAHRFDESLAALEKAALRLRLGDPLDESTEIGPMISAAARDEHARRIAAAEATGDAHRVVRLFQDDLRKPWARAGAYAQPVIAGCDRPDHLLVQEETMSPLLVVQRAEDFEHALALCNGVRHGLIASLFSSSPDHQQRFLDGVAAGVLKLNRSTAGVDVALPFGGWKTSGLGPPEHGVGDALFYTRMQAVYGVGDPTVPG